MSARGEVHAALLRAGYGAPGADALLDRVESEAATSTDGKDTRDGSQPAAGEFTRADDETRRFLARLTGSELPEWRPTFVGINHDGPNAIGPVCTDEDHIASEDPSAFPCCPDPIIEVDPALVDYFVELLNADRAGGAR